MGFIIAIFAYRLNISIEKEGLENEEAKTFWQELKRNFSEVI